MAVTRPARWCVTFPRVLSASTWFLRPPGLAAACETITRQKLKDEEETISWYRVCGRYHLFGATEIIQSCSTRVDTTRLG